MKLTDEQIVELSPEWATHYDINEKYKSILFESEFDFTILKLDSGVFTGKLHQLPEGINKNSKPIPRKPEPFDITQHEWSDEGASFSKCNKEFIVLSTGRDLALDKADCIALAKHFSLTAEDLK